MNKWDRIVVIVTVLSLLLVADAGYSLIRLDHKQGKPFCSNGIQVNP